ncbi:MAG: phage tail tape measure protein [Acidobacteria bacterium]|nr:phage tail tape measure protein [Acidobacteriota bacterium]
MASASVSLSGFRAELRNMIGQYSAFWVGLQAARALGRGAFIGVEFLQQMEDARLSIAALIVAEAKLTDSHGKQLSVQDSLTAAMGLADVQIQKLRISGLQTAATTEQLISAYQDAIGGGLKAGLSLDQIRVLTIQTVQAAGAMHVPMNQLNQEIRSILDGTIDRNSRVAKRLGITNEDVKQWKEAGTLFTELNTKMAAFSEAGKVAQGNWTTITNNIQEAGQILLGEMFRNPFGSMKESLNGILNMMMDIKNATVGEAMKDVLATGKDFAQFLVSTLTSALMGVIGVVMDLSHWWVTNREAIVGVLTTMRDLVAGPLGVAVSIFGFLAKNVIAFGLWLTNTNPIVRTFVVGIGMLTAAKLLLSNVENTLVGHAVTWALAIATETEAVVTQLPWMFARNASMLSSNGIIGGQITLLGGLKAAWLTVSEAAGIARTATMGALGPIGAAAAAIGLLVYGVSRWISAGDEAKTKSLEAFAATQAAAATAAESVTGLVDDLKKANTALRSNKLSAEAHGAAVSELESAVRAISDKYPEFLGFLKKEGDTYTNIDVAFKDMLRAKIAGLAILHKQEVDATNEARHNADAALNYGGAWGSALRTILPLSFIWVNKFKELNKQGDAHFDAAKHITEQMEAYERALNGVVLTAAKGDDKKSNALALQKRYEEDLNTIDNARLAAMEKQTLEQQRQLALDKAIKDAHERDTKLGEDQAADPKRKSKYVALRLENQQYLTQQLTNINKEYDDKALAQEDEFEDAWDATDAGKFARRLAKAKTAFDKLVAIHNAKGLDIISNEERDAKWSEQISDEVTQHNIQQMDKLKSAMDKFQSDNGLVLTLKEQIAMLPAFARSMGLGSRAVADLTMKLKQQEIEQKKWGKGWKTGLKEFYVEGQNAFKFFKNTAMSAMSSVQGAFKQGISQMLQGQMTFSQGMKSIWKGIVGAVADAVAEIIAHYVAMAIARAVMGKAEQENAAADATAAQVSAAAQMFEANSGIPIIGAAIAAAEVALMEITMAGVATAATVPKHAEGGRFTRPTLGIFGEAGPELIAPEMKFVDWTKNVGARVQDQMLAGTRTKAEAAPQRQAPAQSGGHVFHIDMRGATILDSSNRGMKKLGRKMVDAASIAMRQSNGGRLQPGVVFGGR